MSIFLLLLVSSITATGITLLCSVTVNDTQSDVVVLRHKEENYDHTTDDLPQ